MGFWQQLSNIGIHDGLSLAFRKRIILANRIAFIAFSIVSLYTVLFGTMGNTRQTYADIVLLGLLIVYYLLTHKRIYTVARILMSLVITASVFVGTDSAGSNSGQSAPFLYYTTVALSTMLIFTLKEWKALAFVWLVNAGVYIGTFFTPNIFFTYNVNMDPAVAHGIHYMDLVLALFSSSYIVYLLAKSSDMNEEQLEQSLAVSNKQRDDLAATQRELQEAVEEIVSREEELRQNHDELMAVNDHLMDAQEELTQTIDQLKSTQSSLVQSEKMASLGQLVAGVAHEINTPVGVAVTAASTLENATSRFVEIAQNGQMKKSDLTQYVTDAGESSRIILRNLERAAELIKSFKQVAVNSSQEEKTEFKLCQTTDEIVSSLKPALRKTQVEVQTDIPQGLKLHSIPGAISQIFINFVTNSLRYAYDEGQAGRIRIYARPTPTGVHIEYSDDGKGIPPENLDKIFDPFFTTGRSIGGSGLGLNIVYNLVTQKLGGQIRVESTLGKGTTFFMDLPHIN